MTSPSAARRPGFEKCAGRDASAAVVRYLSDAMDDGRCDVCGEPVQDDDEDVAESPFSVSGHGLYIWSRGDKIVYEEPPLCASCGTAIGMSALARWEIEEEEG
jgi:hypothetical protein